MRTAAFAAAAALLLAACGGGGDTPTVDAPHGQADAPPGQPDAMVEQPDAGPCPTIDSCSWLTDYQQDIVGRLSGEREITPGVTITSRASNANRAIVRDFLVAEFTRLGYTPSVQAYAANAGNVIATLAPDGTPATGAIVIGAHFDGVAIAPAAADNATGTSVVLAAARYFATTTGRTHPIIFALFDQEEIGLVGSDHYAQQLVADGTAVLAVHNFDMISWDMDGDQAIELWSPSPALETAYRNVATPLGIPIEPVTFQYSDHQSFLDAGFTTTGVSEEYVSGDYTPHYHKATDTYDKINWPYLAGVTAVGITVIATSAAD